MTLPFGLSLVSLLVGALIYHLIVMFRARRAV